MNPGTAQREDPSKAGVHKVLQGLWARTEDWDARTPEVMHFKHTLAAAEKFFDILHNLERLAPSSGKLSTGVQTTLDQLETLADQLDRTHKLRADWR